jgi:non-ribosomal peptide synthase protein (TIGR01720 family)
MYPVRLRAGSVGDPGTSLNSIKEQVRAASRRALDYGILRFLGDAGMGDRLRGMPAPQIVFNYVGQNDQLLTGWGLFQMAPESRGRERAADGQLTHSLAITAGVHDDRLRVSWTYSSALHRRDTIQWLVDAFEDYLRAIIAHCNSPTSVGYSPSDFPEADMRDEEISILLSQLEDADAERSAGDGSAPGESAR